MNCGYDCGYPSLNRMNFLPLLRHYASNGRRYARAERDWFKSQTSLAAAIEVAATAENQWGKRFHHQRRIRTSAIKAALPALLAAKRRLAKAQTFDELHSVVIDAVNSIPHIGELYCYDTAVRLGAFLGMNPDRVYLHAGVRDGARALGISHTGSFIPVSALPPALRRLPADEAEDFLCIYKDQIIKSTGCGAGPTRRNATPVRSAS